MPCNVTSDAMDPVLRAPTAEENAAVWQMICRAFNFPAEDLERFTSDVETAQGLAAFIDGEVAAYSRIKSFAMFFGGRPVPTGGYSPVGAAPEFMGWGLCPRGTACPYPLPR